MNNEQQPQTIDCTPSWAGILNWYITVLQDGNAEGQKIAKEELRRMAAAADNWVAHCKEMENTMPNGFTAWHETHYEAVCHIMQAKELEGTHEYNVHQSQGTGGLYELAEAYTNEFELLHKGREWDGDFFDTVSDFLEAKSKQA